MTTTTFELGNGRRYKLANNIIMTKGVTNLKRSSSVQFTLKFVAGYRTTKAQFKALKQDVEGYVKKHYPHWKPSVSLQVRPTRFSPNKIVHS